MNLKFIKYYMEYYFNLYLKKKNGNKYSIVY